MMENRNTHQIIVRRHLKVSREKVFAAFSEADALLQWYSPSPDISVEILEFEFSVGGRYRFRYAMLDGSHPVLGGVYIAIKPSEDLIFTWMWEPPDTHADILTQVHIEFLDREGGTELVLTHKQLPSEEVGVRHAEGWERTFDRFEAALHDGKLN